MFQQEGNVLNPCWHTLGSIGCVELTTGLTIEIWRIRAVAGYRGKVRDRLHHLTHGSVILGTSLCSRPSHSGLLPLKTPQTQCWPTSSNSGDPHRRECQSVKGSRSRSIPSFYRPGNWDLTGTWLSMVTQLDSIKTRNKIRNKVLRESTAMNI